MFKKNRTQERKLLSNLGFIQMLGDDGGQILNISETGLRFATFAPLGHVRNVHFWFSLNLRDRIDANGEVAWLDAETKSGGLRFLNLSERALKHIRAYATGSPFKESSERGKFFAAAFAKRDSERTAIKSEAGPSGPAHGATAGSSPAFRLLDHPLEKSPVLPASVASTDLISLQRHLAACRRQLYLGIVIGVVLASILAIPLTRYFDNRNPIQGSREPVATPANENTTSEMAPGQTSPTASSSPSALNISAPMNAQRSVATHSYSNTSINNSSKRISTVSSSPFSEGSPNTNATSKSAQLRESAPAVAKKSAATPQQLWSAVQAGDTNAAVLLADRYLRGDGVPANCVQARVLLLAASERKNPAAIKKLHELDQNGCS